MDWKVFATTFASVFVAELGDKTQFVALAASSSSQSRISVWLGVVLGLAVAGSIGVLAGRFVAELVEPSTLKTIAGVLFIAMGVLVLWK